MNDVRSLEEYHNYLKAILYFFDDLCRKNDIKYTVMDGTLLGAIRHKGLIPWDGDVDVALTHKEFEKLKKVFEAYDGRYYLDFFPNHYYKDKKMLKDYGTITAKVIDKKCNTKLYGLDVFTIDFLGDDKDFAEKTVKQYRKIFNKQALAISLHRPHISANKSFARKLKVLLINLLYPFLKLYSLCYTPIFKKKYKNLIEKRLCFDEKSKYFSIEPYLNRIGVEDNTILSEGYIDTEFENFKVMIVKNYDAYLKPTYGNYMELPPKDKQVPYPSEEELLEIKFELDDELKDLLNKVK